MVAALASAGCFRDPVDVDASGDGVVMIGLVSAGTDTASVVLARVGSEQTPETGATLRLDTPRGEVDLLSSAGTSCGLPAGWACYRGAYVEATSPGDEVLIEGSLADGTRISGRTVVPPRPELVLSEEGSPVPDTVRFGYGRTPWMSPTSPTEAWFAFASGPARAYVWAGGTSLVCSVSIDRTYRAFDTTPSIAVPIGDPICEGATIAWDSMAVDLRVAMFDTSFTAYWQHTTADPDAILAADASWGVEGVFGVFGSSASRPLVAIVRGAPLPY